MINRCSSSLIINFLALSQNDNNPSVNGIPKKDETQSIRRMEGERILVQRLLCYSGGRCGIAILYSETLQSWHITISIIANHVCLNKRSHVFTFLNSKKFKFQEQRKWYKLTSYRTYKCRQLKISLFLGVQTHRFEKSVPDREQSCSEHKVLII